MNKANLPIKTKIAIWWLFIIGIAVPIIWILSYIIGFCNLDYLTALFFQSPWGFAILLVSISCIPPLILLSQKSKSAWKETIVILSILIICFLAIGLPYLTTQITDVNDYDVSHLRSHFPYLFIFIPLLFIVYAVPFILLILDRKNYFEMVRQRELEKKENG
jgi:hypothetical protein